jgi:hypothetical protein
MDQRDFEAERGTLQCRHCKGRGELVTRLNLANNGLEVICPRCGRWDPLHIGGYLSRRHPKEPTMPVMTFGKFKGQELCDVPTGALEHYLNWDGLYKDQRQAILAERRRAPMPRQAASRGPRHRRRSHRGLTPCASARPT